MSTGVNGFHHQIDRPRFTAEDYQSPPKNLDAERAVVGALLRDPSKFSKIGALLSPSDFFDPALQEIYRAIENLHRQNQPFDGVTVGEELIRRQMLKVIGGQDFLCELVEENLTGANGPYYAEIVREVSIRRRMFYACDDAKKFLVEQKNTELVREILRDATEDAGQTNQLIETFSIGELMEQDLDVTPICEGVLYAGQHCVIGGREKCMKTTLALALLLSISTRTMFLGRFVVPEKLPVMFLSGESGARTIRETLQRIAKSNGISLHSADLRLGFQAPRLSDPKVQRELEKLIIDHGIKVLGIDPLYLSLLDAQTAGSASNIYAMGAALAPLSEMANRTECTLVLCHHFKKSAQTEPFGVPQLADLAMSGTAEFARSWMLLSRLEEYSPGTGTHKLAMSVGGSAGHSGCHALEIDEGRVDDSNLTGRIWRVAIGSLDAAKADATKAKADAKMSEKRQSVVDALDAYKQGETANVLKDYAGVNGSTFARIIKSLVDDGIAVPIKIAKSHASYDGFISAKYSNSDNSDNSDSPTCPGMSDRPFSGQSDYLTTQVDSVGPMLGVQPPAGGF